MEQINSASDDDITNFTDEQQVSVDRVNGYFRQHSKLKGIECEFTIFNDIQCYLSVVRKHAGKQKFRVNLSYLDPNPEEEHLKTFINILQKHILQAQDTAALPVTDQLTLEIQELPRLKNETAITESVYERAKRRIFKNSAFKA